MQHRKSIFFLLLCIILTFSFCTEKRSVLPARQETEKELSLQEDHTIADEAEYRKLEMKADSALQFCRQKKYNTEYCMLVNMHKHSGKFRFFIWDFTQHKAIDSGLVSHGCGIEEWSVDHSKEQPQFSNVIDSHCSSLGKYRIGNRGYSSFGIHVNYLIHGLDTTNNNALERDIVLHSWDVMEDAELYPEGSAESWGCPAVSNNFMLRIDDRLQQTDNSVLLWIFI